MFFLHFSSFIFFFHFFPVKNNAFLQDLFDFSQLLSAWHAHTQPTEGAVQTTAAEVTTAEERIKAAAEAAAAEKAKVDAAKAAKALAEVQKVDATLPP